MEKKLYEIKPLEWVGKSPEISLTANIPLGYYSINKKLLNNGSELRSGYYVSYCFDEYYDNGRFDVDSMEDGKQKAFEHWCERLSKCLAPVDPDRWTPVEDEFVNLVKRMREAQRRYFKTRRSDYMAEAKYLEKAVDIKIAEMEAAKLPEQKTLF